MNSGTSLLLASGLAVKKVIRKAGLNKKLPYFSAFSTTSTMLFRKGPMKIKDHKQAWLEENTSLYKVPKDIKPEELKPVSYLGKYGNPFPLNPLFKPTAPFPEELKKKMYEAYLKDPNNNTPRKLAVQYRISIRRAEAILKLKHLETAMSEKGFVPLTNYQVGMERLLGANTTIEPEDLEIINPKLGKPLFVAVEEGVDFQPEDAAGLLRRQHFTKLTDKLLEDKVFTYRGISGKDYGIETEEKPKPIAEDPELGTHRAYDFMFSDINPNLTQKDQVILIREKNGILRDASLNERFHRARRTGWPNQHLHFRRPKPSKNTQ